MDIVETQEVRQMEYSIRELAQLEGISTRTLRYMMKLIC